MKSGIQHLCLQYIIDEWRKLRPLQIRDEPPEIPPWGVWIRLYKPIPISQNDLHDTQDTLLQVWFLTERGLEERDPWEYARFIMVIGYRPWSIMPTKPREVVWGRRYHEIALAAFAEIIEDEKLYLEIQWGRLWGRGYQMKVDEQNTLQIEETVWVS
jgi:hypothetical protein